MKKEGDYVTIAEEVEFMENYTKILDFRYFNKFDVTYEVDPAVMNHRTLKFLLQPLVENAVFHGFEGIDYKGSLVISIDEESDALIMKVCDNGRGFPEGGQAKVEQDGPQDTFNSIGLNNIRNRISLHFGPSTACGSKGENKAERSHGYGFRSSQKKQGDSKCEYL